MIGQKDGELDKMNILLIVITAYFVIGFLALCILEVFTRRITTRLRSASVDTQVELGATGNFVGTKSAFVLTLFALLLFWPVAIYGALSSGGKKPDE